MSHSAFVFPDTPPPFATQAPATKKLMRSVRDFLHKELCIDLKEKHFLLAISGGADSLALLCLWQWLRPVYKYSFSVLHIDHQLRVESAEEARTVRALCEAWHIPHFSERVAVQEEAQHHKTGLEETARKVRYTLYEQYRQKCGAHWVCLGHHVRDLQEDVLMRLMRGAGWPALGGMTALDPHRHILRPLLLQEPEHLRQALQYAGFTWAEDASNADTQYLRNRVRHTILPLFLAENPSFAQKISELWHFASHDQEHWQHILHTLCQEYHVQCQENTVTLPAKLLKKSDTATRLRLYMHAVHLLTTAKVSATGQARAQTLFKLDTALQEGRGNTTFEFPGNISARVAKGSVSFFISIGY